MKRKILLWVMLCAFDSVFAQSQLVKQWDYRFGGTLGDGASNSAKTFDGGYILGGNSLSDSSGDKTQQSWGSIDFWVVKIDSVGIKQWDKRYGGNNVDQLFDIKQTSDKGYILGGWSGSEVTGDVSQPDWDTLYNTIDFWLIKIDSVGEKIWDKRFGGTKNDWLNSLYQTADGGYIAGGYSYSDMDGDKSQHTRGRCDYWILKMDSLGNKQWDKRYGGKRYEYLTSVEQTTDGGYILGGNSDSRRSGDITQDNHDTIWQLSYDFWVVKIDSLGHKLWDKRFGGIDDEWSRCGIQQTKEGGYIFGAASNSSISGDKTEPSKGAYDYWIVKLDSAGNKLWDKDFGGNQDDILWNIYMTYDNGYILSGESYSQASGDKSENNLGTLQPWIVKIDSLGNKTWDKTIFSPSDSRAPRTIQSNDECYVIISTTNSGIGGYKTQPNRDTICTPVCTSDYWILKFCDTTLVTNVQTVITHSYSSLTLSPNPASTYTTISGMQLNHGTEIRVTNTLGETVFSEIISAAAERYQLPVVNFANGIYFLSVQTGKERITGKVVVNH